MAGGAWRGVVRDLVLTLRQDGPRIHYESAAGGDALPLLRDLFLLDVDLREIQAALCAADPALAEPIGRAPGLRLMRQDPEECLLSFLCSTANNVPRIVSGIRRLSAALGAPLDPVGGQPYYTFPSVGAVAGADPAHLQALTGLGYRAGRLVEVARALDVRGPAWLPGLRQAPYHTAHSALMELRGIGPKVADCACLFSLDHTEAVPVDTHIWQVARQRWNVEAQAGSGSAQGKPREPGLTGAAYRRVGDLFRARYGRLAGYAQNWLFYDHFRGYWGGSSPLLKAAPEQR